MPMLASGAALDLGDPHVEPLPSTCATLEALVRQHFTFVWRSLRRLGVPAGDADDAAQQVFLTTSGKVACIRPGCERSFLFGVALRTAQRWRRTAARRRETTEDALTTRRDSSPGPDELCDRERARRLLDTVLDEMPPELRDVFVSYELEELTMAEIAEALGLPPGTVASRLRRARAHFSERVARLDAPGARS